MSGKKAIIAFVPVLHEGYRNFFEKHSGAETLFIFGKDLVEQEFPHLQKEIRALEPEVMKKVLEALNIFKKIKILDLKELQALAKENWELIFPDEDVSRELAEKYFKDNKVTFDKVFLRWDRHKSMEERPVETLQKISKSDEDKKLIQLLENEAEKGSDWWRRIAAAIVQDGKVIFIARNEHWPSEHSPYADGDPRNNFKKGIEVELSTSMHSEASLIAQAAKEGVSLDGASMYVTVFPCPPCAKLVASSGIKKLYYSGGYALLDQDQLLQTRGVEIIYVETDKEISPEWKGYKK